MDWSVKIGGLLCGRMLKLIYLKSGGSVISVEPGLYAGHLGANKKDFYRRSLEKKYIKNFSIIFEDLSIIYLTHMGCMFSFNFKCGEPSKFIFIFCIFVYKS